MAHLRDAHVNRKNDRTRIGELVTHFFGPLCDRDKIGNVSLRRNKHVWEARARDARKV